MGSNNQDFSQGVIDSGRGGQGAHARGGDIGSYNQHITIINFSNYWHAARHSAVTAEQQQQQQQQSGIDARGAGTAADSVRQPEFAASTRSQDDLTGEQPQLQLPEHWRTIQVLKDYLEQLSPDAVPVQTDGRPAGSSGRLQAPDAIQARNQREIPRISSDPAQAAERPVSNPTSIPHLEAPSLNAVQRSPDTRDPSRRDKHSRSPAPSRVQNQQPAPSSDPEVPSKNHNDKAPNVQSPKPLDGRLLPANATSDSHPRRAKAQHKPLAPPEVQSASVRPNSCPPDLARPGTSQADLAVASLEVADDVPKSWPDFSQPSHLIEPTPSSSLLPVPTAVLRNTVVATRDSPGLVHRRPRSATPDIASLVASTAPFPRLDEAKYTMQATDPTKTVQTRKLDLLFILDATHSMYGSPLEGVIRRCSNVALTLHGSASGKDKIEALRFGLIAFRDYGDDFVVNDFGGFTDDFSVFFGNLTSLRGAGGGDGPEAVTSALVRASELSWRKDAAKVAMLITDAPPHDIEEMTHYVDEKKPDSTDPLVLARELSKRGIRLLIVPFEEKLFRFYQFALDFYKALAFITSGSYIDFEDYVELAPLILKIAFDNHQMKPMHALPKAMKIWIGAKDTPSARAQLAKVHVARGMARPPFQDRIPPRESPTPSQEKPFPRVPVTLKNSTDLFIQYDYTDQGEQRWGIIPPKEVAGPVMLPQSREGSHIFMNLATEERRYCIKLYALEGTEWDLAKGWQEYWNPSWS